MNIPHSLLSSSRRPVALALCAFVLLSGCAHRVDAGTAAASAPVRVEAASNGPNALVVESADDRATADRAGGGASADAPVAEAPVANPPVSATPVADRSVAQTPIDAQSVDDPSIDHPPVSDPPVDARPTAGDDPRTQAERDFDALYGVQEPYDPVADPTLPPPAQQAAAYDPWEKFNRRMHRFNNAVDRRVAKPLANAYVKAVPRPVRLGVGNFFNNLGQPVSAVNALLQGKPKQAGQSLGRFLLNSTLGIAGVFDPATSAKLPNKSEDFGQTLGVWGWKKSRYVELPLFGPRTVRDVVGMVGDSPLSPTRQIEEDRVRVFLQGLQLVDLRAQLLSTDSFREGAADDYALVRDAWMQRRQYQIFGDRNGAKDTDLPDYLRDDVDPTIPIDAMPVQLPDGPR